MKPNLKKLILLIATALTLIMITGCVKRGTGTDPESMGIYRQHMRDFVQGISAYAKGINPGFNIIPQNGHELLTENGDEAGPPAVDYIDAIDGVGREDLFYGYIDDDTATPQSERDYMIAFMDIAEANGVEVLVTDYCSTRSYMDDSYADNNSHDYISFAADHRDLDNIPVYPATPYSANSSNIHTLAEAGNFLYLLNPGSFANKTDFINSIQGTNYDIVIIDLFFAGNDEFTIDEINSLKAKANGGARLVIAYMSIGEAEDYRYYWQESWYANPPSWLASENPDWPGNYKVRFWDSGWQGVIFGNAGSYLRRILDAGFDGVYLDIIDAYEFFE